MNDSVYIFPQTLRSLGNTMYLKIKYQSKINLGFTRYIEKTVTGYIFGKLREILMISKASFFGTDDAKRLS